MPGAGDDEREEGRGRPDRGARRGPRERSDRARRADEQGREPGRGRQRPPIKGKRRTFDVDSGPNERERNRGEQDGSRHDEQWVDEGPVRRAADDAVKRGSRPPRGKGGKGAKGGERTDAQQKPRQKSGPGKAQQKAAGKGGASNRRRAERATKRAESVMEIDRSRLEQRLGKARADRTVKRLGDATAAYAEERYEDARKTLKPIAELIPDEPTVRELYGLTLYRLGRWRLAANELGEFARRSGSTEQYPVLADCYRALGQHTKVEELWDDIAEASLAAPLVAEGRIVMAGSLADRGRVTDALDVLERGALGSSNLKEHHLRMRYVLGDLYDRAGDHQAARRYFQSVADTSPEFYDVQERLQHV